MQINNSIVGSFYVIFLLMWVSCSIDRTIPSLNEEEQRRLINFQQLASEHVVAITGDDEPGESLVLAITLVRKEDGSPIPLKKIHLYHTDVSGQYTPKDPSDESTARLHGLVTTDTLGRFLVKTILPGDYGSSPDNRHIHFTVEAAHPVAYDIHFKQYTTMMGKRFIARSDQHFLADLRRQTNRDLVAFVTIEAKRVEL